MAVWWAAEYIEFYLLSHGEMYTEPISNYIKREEAFALIDWQVYASISISIGADGRHLTAKNQ